VFALQINHRTSVTPHITFLAHTVVIQLLVLGIEQHNRLGWIAFRVRQFSHSMIAKFFIPSFPVLRFLLPRYISVPSTLNIAFI